MLCANFCQRLFNKVCSQTAQGKQANCQEDKGAAAGQSRRESPAKKQPEMSYCMLSMQVLGCRGVDCKQSGGRVMQCKCFDYVLDCLYDSKSIMVILQQG